MKANDFKAEIAKLNVDELKERARVLSEELMKLRFRKASGQLDKSSRLQEVRRSLARVKTSLTARSNKSN